MSLKRNISMLIFIITCSLHSLKLLVFLFIKRATSFLHETRTESQSDTAKTEFIEHEPKTDGEAKDTILLLHGFPDNPSLWDDTVEALTNAGYRCIVAAFPASRGERLSSLPYLKDILNQVRDAAKGRGKVTILAFDWGSFVANIVLRTNPELFKRAIILDVGKMKFSMFSGVTLCILAYQTTFALCYMIGGEVGSSTLKNLLSQSGYVARPVEDLTADMAFWYRMILPLFFKSNNKSSEQNQHNVTIPTLFAYGKKKLFMFHDEDWLEKVQKSPGGRVVGFNADHWFMMWKSDEWTRLCVEWLEETKEYAKTTVS